MNKEFTQICREILALGDMIRNSGLNEQLIAGSVEEARQIKEQIEKIRDQILAHTGGGGIGEESLNEIKNELNLKLSIAAAEALYATKDELSNIDGLLSSENAEATYLKIEAADTKFATKEELAAASLGGGDNSAAIEQLQNSINAKLGKDEAEGIYAKISQIPSVEGLLSAQIAEETYLKKVDKPNIDNLATKAELENYATKEQIPDVSNFITQTQGDERYALKGQGDGNGSGLDPNLFLQKNDAESMYAKKASVEVLENAKLGKSEKAADSALFNGNSEEVFVKHINTSETATNSSVVKRTADGSIAATNINVSGNLNLADTQTEDGALVPDAHIVFSEANGKALMRGSVNKLKQLVAPDLSGYLTSNAADGKYALKNEISSDYTIRQVLGSSLNLEQEGVNFSIDGSNGITVTASSGIGKSGFILVSNAPTKMQFYGNCIVLGVKPDESEFIVQYFIQSPSKIYLVYPPCDTQVSKELINITSTGERQFLLGRSVTNITAGRFQSNSSLFEVEGGNIKTIGDNNFKNCENLLSINIPSLASVSNSVFFGCNKLEYLNLPRLTTAGISSFSYLQKIKEIALPNLTRVNGYLFNFCGSLETLIMPKADVVATSNILNQCYELKKIVCKKGMKEKIIKAVKATDSHNVLNRVIFVEA